jgi:uncharacterized protein (DUF427 family)
MPRAVFNGQVVAESDEMKVVEGNAYFPPEALKLNFFRASDRATVCGWKGTASYFDVIVGDRTAEAAAWYYPERLAAAERIKNHVAFWHGVTVEW